MITLLFLALQIYALEIPSDLVAPKDLHKQFLLAFNNFTYQLELNSIVTEIDNCKSFRSAKTLTICIDRKKESHKLTEDISYFIDGGYSTKITYIQNGPDITPTSNNLLYQFKFPVHNNTTSFTLNLFNIVISQYKKEGRLEHATFLSDNENFRLHIIQRNEANYIGRDFAITCNQCSDARLRVLVTDSKTYYYHESSGDIDPFLFRQLYGQIYLNIFQNFSKGLFRYASGLNKIKNQE